MKYIKSTMTIIILSQLIVRSFSQETAKEEIGNTTYLSDELVDENLELSRLERQKELLTSTLLFEPGKTHTYTGEYLEAIEFPIGAFGGGHLILDGTGKLKYWKIFNNNNLAYVPYSFFAVRAKMKGGKTIVRALQTDSAGKFPPMQDLKFQGEYPFAKLRYVDSEIPAEITMEAFNPFIPMELKKSSIPCAIFSLTALNPTSEEMEISFLYSQQNAVGYYPIIKHGGKNSSTEFFINDIEFDNLNRIEGIKYRAYGGNVNQLHKNKGSAYLHFTKIDSVNLLGYGDMTIGLIGEKGDATAKWETLDELYNIFYKKGVPGEIKKSEPSADGETVNGALSKTFLLKPGESKTLTFYLTWHFPNGDRGSYSENYWGRGKWGGDGNMYANWWKNSVEVADYLQDNFDELSSLTHLYHNSFYKANFPHWLKDRISAQTSILKTNTLFWDKNGYIGGWEGISPIDGACSGNCTHVWHYAQAIARLFPEAGRKMREQSLSYMKEDGMIPYRHPNGHEAFDGQCGEILQAYREHLTSTKNNWLNLNYSKIIKATDFIIRTWDPNKDGILEGPKHNTLDSRLGGNSSWHGSLYAATLKASAEMALLNNEPQVYKRFNELSEKAVQSHLKTLWNGEYFIQIPDSIPQADFLTGCAADQLLGQWWANQLGFGSLYPEEIISRTMQSVFKYNFKANFLGIRQTPREFVKPNEAGLLMITWPKGGRPNPHTSYADEVMSGFEYAAAATMIQSENLNKGLTILKAASDRYNGKLKVGYKGAWGNWGYSGNPFGDDECGKFYSRAMSIWSVLLALQGYSFDGPAKSIGFNPVWKPENHVSFFTVAQGWGTFHQKRESGKQINMIELLYGKLELAEIRINLEKDVVVKDVLITVGKQKTQAIFLQRDTELTANFKNTILNEGQSLLINVQY